MHPSAHPQLPALRCRHGRLVDSLLLHDLNLPSASQPAQRVQGLLDPHCFITTGPGTNMDQAPQLPGLCGEVQGQRDSHQGSFKSQLHTCKESVISSGWASTELSLMLH